MATCPCRHVSKTFSQPFHIIVIHCSDLLICMVTAPLPAQGQEIGPQQGAKCAFNLNNPFNLSSIMWKQLGALILLQFEGNSLELTSMRTAVEVYHARKLWWKLGLVWQFDGEAGLLKLKASKQTIGNVVFHLLSTQGSWKNIKKWRGFYRLFSSAILKVAITEAARINEMQTLNSV